MKTRVCYLKTTLSKNFNGMTSVRGRNGEAPQEALTAAGFKAGETVVVLSEQDFKELVALLGS